MKRQRVRPDYTEFNDNDVQLINHNKLKKSVNHTLEATVLDGDNLTSIALRFNCSVADLKRLNKIDKDNEIFAHKILKIPITPHNVLLDTNLPTVHKSGNSSPKIEATSNNHVDEIKSILTDESLEEKLIVASISNTTYKDHNVPIVQTTDLDIFEQDLPDASDPLLINGERRQPKVILAKPKVDFSFNGSDCDMNWLCLFICILALCFAIPLIYVYFIYEEKVHPEHFHPISTHSIPSHSS